MLVQDWRIDSVHALISARGMPDWLNRWEGDCRARYIPVKLPKGMGKKQGLLEVSLRPVRIYDLVFPEEQYDNVMSMLYPNEPKGLGTIMTMVRKALGFSKPKKWITKKGIKIPRWNVTVTLLGVKKDKRDKDGIELI